MQAAKYGQCDTKDNWQEVCRHAQHSHGILGMDQLFQYGISLNIDPPNRIYSNPDI